MQHAPPGQGHPGQYPMMAPQQYPIPGGPAGHIYSYGPAVGVPMHESYVMSQHVPPAPGGTGQTQQQPHQHSSPHVPHSQQHQHQSHQHNTQSHISQSGMYPPMPMNK